MSQDELKAVQTQLNKEYFLVHRRTLNLFIALLVGLGLFTMGVTFFAVKTAISTVAAATATQEIERLSKEANEKIEQIQAKHDEAEKFVTSVRQGDSDLRSITVKADFNSTNNDRFHIFVVTHSDKIPVACLSNNPGGKDSYPKVLFVVTGKHEDQQGVHIVGNLTAPATEGWCLTFSLMQQGMKGDCPVIPIR